MGNPIVHFEINGKDGPRLIEFYRQLFGWKIDNSNPMGYGLVDTETPEGVGGGISGDSEPGVGFYVGVADLDATLKAAERMGGRVVTPITTIPGMVTMAQFADPEGNVIGLVDASGPPPAE